MGQCHSLHLYIAAYCHYYSKAYCSPNRLAKLAANEAVHPIDSIILPLTKGFTNWALRNGRVTYNVVDGQTVMK